MASRDDRGINTTSLANNLRQINGLTDTNNQEITEITLPKSVKLNNIKYKIKEDGTVIINNSLLPVEYQQVEYIESSGTQWIDTEFIPNQDTRIVTTFQYTKNNQGYRFTGQENKNPLQQRFRFGTSMGKYWLIAYGNSETITVGISDTNIHNLDMNKNIYYLDNEVLKEFNYQEFSGYGNIYIFSVNSPSIADLTPARLFKYKLYDNSVLVRNFIPCKSNTNVTDVDGKPCSAGTAGLYDTVNGQFYTNQGTGTFGYETEDGTYVAPSPTNN